MLPAGAFLAKSGARALLIGSLILVLIVELLNPGIEAAIDRISTEWHPLSKGCPKGSASAGIAQHRSGCLVRYLTVKVGRGT